MKKKFITVALVTTLCGSMFLSSCIGSFQLTNNLLEWNRSIDRKWINELVFVAFWILPVYEVAAMADILVINSIEFWSGSNPIEKGTYSMTGSDGTPYSVKCDKKGYTIVNLNDNSKVRFDFEPVKKEWSFTAKDGKRVVFMTFIDDTHVKLPMPDGTNKIVETSQEGLFAYREAAGLSDMAMLK